MRPEWARPLHVNLRLEGLGGQSYSKVAELSVNESSDEYDGRKSIDCSCVVRQDVKICQP
jgi:hypothetical protein